MVKGEAFLLASLIIVVSLVLMYLPMRREYLIKQESILKKEYEEKVFENLINEIKNTAYISYGDFDSCIKNLYDFLNFSKKYLNSRGLSFYYLILVGNISTIMNITGINAFDNTIEINITIDKNNSKNLIINEYSINSILFSLIGDEKEIEIEYKDVKKSVNLNGNLILYLDLLIDSADYSKRYVDVFVYR
ncbi:MAG: hypothetical protein QXW01_02215 [Candidatus Aenigmatarchaeota archaeon]